MLEKKLFFEAVEITDPKRRSQFVKDACGENEILRRRVNALLSAASVVGDFLEPEQPSRSRPLKKDQPENVSDSLISLDFLEPTSDPKCLGRLAHYDVMSVLGSGAFGIVLKAFDRRLHRHVAIKVLSPQLATTSPPRKRFLREARSCAAIKHANVVHLYEVADQPTPYIVMEYLDGQTLQERIDDAGPLEISEIIQIAEQLASGLEAAHQVGLIHRDIKPSNVLVEGKVQMRAVLTDFGLARAADDASLTQSGVLTGTPIYMSPEQTKGQKLDARTDLFSLGSLLYVMITGRPPFRARNTIAVLQRVANSNARPIPEINPDSPEWLNSLVEKLHEKDPAKRIQSATEVLKILTQRGDSIDNAEARPAKKSEAGNHRGSRDSKSNSWVRIGSTAVLLLIILIFIAMVYGPDHSQYTTDSSLRESNSSGQHDSQALPERPAGFTLGGARQSETIQSESRPVSNAPSAVWDGWSSDAPQPAVAPFDRNQALQHQKAWAAYLGVPVEFTDKLGMTFRLIPPGEFTMGTSEAGIQSRLHHVKHDSWWTENLLSEGPQRKVVISRPFYLATTELTQNQFESIMSYNPAYFQRGGEKGEFVNELDTHNLPMDGASWDEIQTFLKRLHLRSGHVGKAEGKNVYRLPTEAEWEFACRGGTQTDFWTGDDALKFLEHENVESQIGRTSAVGEYPSNPFGLYDIAGNVHEYVQDLWDTRYRISSDEQVSVDPTGPVETEWGSRVARGGDYWWWSYHSRSSYRIGILPDERSGLTIGCRLALDAESYSLASNWKSADSAVTGFSEIHGASQERLKTWLAEIRGHYLPVRVNLRWGDTDSHFDAIAIDSDATEGPWEVHFFKDDMEAGRDFFRMRQTHDIFWKLLIPQAGQHPMNCPGLKIWRQTDRTSATWNLGNENLLTEINKVSSKGAFPMSLAYTESGSGKNNAYVQHHRPGFGNRSFIRISLPEFKTQVEQHRERKWRPHFFQLATGTPELQINCTFQENLDRVDWDMTFDLTQADYERELNRRKLDNWYPACVGSYVEDGIVRYLAAWEKVKVSRNSGGFRGDRRSGGFGGR